MIGKNNIIEDYDVDVEIYRLKSKMTTEKFSMNSFFYFMSFSYATILHHI